ncbi:MAG: amidase [Gammaproteobacteria bacterium]|nr:amidase [Gammaproteobacteria bacterium]
MELNRREFIGAGSAAVALFLSKRGLAQPADPTDLGIAEAGPLIRSGDLSPVELVQAYLQRIARLDGELNAFITLTEESALARARALEAELARGEWRGPLHGIPIALKDNIDTAGVLTTAGSELFASRVPDRDAAAVTRLERAGAIVLGKTNMHEFAYGASSAITHYGPVHNPWDLDRIPGGSSGGSAAAVSARLCAGALGTDTGGSIRMPAAYCGIVGLKPTYGLASIRGIIPLSVTLDHVGPMCRTVADSALMLQALAGYDPRDIASIRTSVPDYSSALHRATLGMRLGVPRSLFFEDVQAEIINGVERALDVLSELTASMTDVDLPPLPQARPVLVESYAYHAEYLETSPDLYDAATREQILRGVGISAKDYAESLYEVELSRKAIDAVFDDVDLLITPTMARQPVDIETALAAPVEINPTLIRNASPFNTYGVPTISIPCGFSNDGLPIGLQISGRSLGELDVLALAHAYEQATDWHETVPPVS